MLHLQFKYGGVDANQERCASLQRPAHVENILKHTRRLQWAFVDHEKGLQTHD